MSSLIELRDPDRAAAEQINERAGSQSPIERVKLFDQVNDYRMKTIPDFYFKEIRRIQIIAPKIQNAINWSCN